MSKFTQKVDILGRRESGTLTTTTVQRVFASLSVPAAGNRQGISLANCDASAELYATLAPTGAAAPAVSASDHDFTIPPRGSRQLQIGAGIEIWIRSSSASSITYTAVELL